MSGTWLAGRVIGADLRHFDEGHMERIADMADERYPGMLQAIREQINGEFFEWLDSLGVSNDDLIRRTDALIAEASK